MGMATSLSTFDTNGMVASRSILDTNGYGSIPVDTRHKWGWCHPGRYPSRHKWEWHHPGRYSTQIVMASSRSILDTNRDGSISGDTRHKWGWQHPGQHSTQMGWQHPGRYSTQMGMVPPRSIPLSTQMGMAAPRSILDTNGDGATPVDTRHKW